MFVAWMTTVHVLAIGPLFEVLHKPFTLEQLTTLNLLHSNPPKL